MAATDFIYSRNPLPSGQDVPVKNTSATAMTAGQLVKLDTAHVLSGTQQTPGVALCAAVADYPYGVLAENIPVGGTGRCQLGGLAIVYQDGAGAIAVGSLVGSSATTAGQAAVYTAANPSLGQAVTASANQGDPLLVRIAISKNA